MTLRERGCLNRHMGGGGGWPYRHKTFIVAKKSLIYSLFCYLRYFGERRLVENVIWGRGWLKTSKYRHIGGGNLKLLKKNVI